MSLELLQNKTNLKSKARSFKQGSPSVNLVLMWKAAWCSGGGSMSHCVRRGRTATTPRGFYFLLCKGMRLHPMIPQNPTRLTTQNQKDQPSEFNKASNFERLVTMKLQTWQHFASALKATWSMTHIPSKSQIQVQGSPQSPKGATPFPDNIIRRNTYFLRAWALSYKGF